MDNKRERDDLKDKDKDLKKKKGKHKKDRKPKDEVPIDHNDWTFYAASDQIAKDVASLPFNYLGGTSFRLKNKYITVSNVNDPESWIKGEVEKQNALPSVMVFDYVNSIGITNKRTQGVNMAATQLYTMVRHANSGAKNYEAADIMMYVLAMRDIYSEYFTLKAIIGTAGLFNYYNHAIPDSLLKAHGIDADDLRSNLAQYRGRLNLLAKKINSFAVPQYFKIFDRSIYISSYIFGDSDSIRGQMYLFRKAGYYTWSGITSEQGTELIYTDHADESTLAERLDILENMLDALFLDEDALTMSGDILKAFKDQTLYNVTETKEDYIVDIVDDINIKMQIQNAKTLNYSVYNELFRALEYKYNLEKDFNVKQENQVIKFEPKIWFTNTTTTGAITLYQNRLYTFTRLPLNSCKDAPDYKDILEWTRLMTMSEMSIGPTRGDADSYSVYEDISSTGLEIILDFRIVGNSTDGEPTSSNKFGTLGLNLGAVNRDEISKFDYHPIILSPGNTQSSINFMGDCKVITLVDKDILDKINDAAVYGALYGSSLYNNTNKK